MKNILCKINIGTTRSLAVLCLFALTAIVSLGLPSKANAAVTITITGGGHLDDSFVSITSDGGDPSRTFGYKMNFWGGSGSGQVSGANNFCTLPTGGTLSQKKSIPFSAFSSPRPLSDFFTATQGATFGATGFCADATGMTIADLNASGVHQEPYFHDGQYNLYINVFCTNSADCSTSSGVDSTPRPSGGVGEAFLFYPSNAPGGGGGGGYSVSAMIAAAEQGYASSTGSTVSSDVHWVGGAFTLPFLGGFIALFWELRYWIIAFIILNLVLAFVMYYYSSRN